MARLDIGEALGEGFRLVGRRPLDVMVWGLAYFLFGILPMIAIFWWMSGSFIEWARYVDSHPGMTDPSQMFAQQMKLQAMQPVMFLGGLVGRTLLCAAVLRAVLTPEDRGFFSLKLSKTELWLALVLLVQGVCIFLAVFGLMIPVMIFWVPTFIAASQHSFGGWEIPLGALAALAALVVFFWLLIRFSMAAPMTFAARQFRLFESWKLTRGHTVGLFALYLVNAIIVGCIGMVVEVVIAVIVFAILAGMGVDAASWQDFFHRDPQAVIAAIAPWAIGAGLIFSVVGGVLAALMLAPWARAYAQLAEAEQTA
jgi:hypothetical protein